MTAWCLVLLSIAVTHYPSPSSNQMAAAAAADRSDPDWWIAPVQAWAAERKFNCTVPKDRHRLRVQSQPGEDAPQYKFYNGNSSLMMVLEHRCSRHNQFCQVSQHFMLHAGVLRAMLDLLVPFLTSEDAKERDKIARKGDDDFVRVCEAWRKKSDAAIAQAHRK